MEEYTLELATSYLALGLDPDKCVFWKQSDVLETTNLCWIFSCLTPIPWLERAHAFKDAKETGKKEINSGLFLYPILQAADILLYKSTIVPVGKDQKQHIEMTRDIAIRFNDQYGNVFPEVKPLIEDSVAVIPGIDGEKMSKSYGNTIEMFAPENQIKKSVMRIVTDSLGVEDKKDPEKCNVFKLYKLFGDKDGIKKMDEMYRKGGMGYGDAKKILLEKILTYFKPYRDKYDELKKNPNEVLEVLKQGKIKATKVAKATMDVVNKKIGI
jgi:tryptophanyl-tRNA synthetase